MNGENNFSNMLRSLKYYYAHNKKRVHMQVLITVIIVTVVIGQAAQSVALFTNSIKSATWNPFILFYYAWFKAAPISLFITIALNAFAIYITINLEDRFYDKERNFRISPKGTMGTGGFMEEEDKEKALIRDTIENIDGSILGKDIDTGLMCTAKESLYLNGHKVICGGSGSRKTTTQALNEIFQIIKREESFITTDPKAEIVAMVKHICEKNGYETKILNLVNPENSDGIDFVKLVRNKRGDIDKEVPDVQTLVKVIMSNTGAMDGKNAFWDDCQQGLLTAAILYVMHDETGKTSPTLGGAYDFLLKNDKTEIDRVFTNLDKNHPAKASYLLYAKADNKVRDSVIIGLMMRLQVLQSDAIKKIVSEDEIDLVLPSKKKCAYFIVMSDQKSTFDFISSLTFSMFFIKQVEQIDSLQTRRAEVVVNLVMDEFPSIGTIPDFSRKLATLRSRRIYITIIFQNFGQIIDKYENNEWQTIVSNCDTNIYLGGNDINETAEFYTKRLGEMTVISEGKRTTENIASITNNRYHPNYMKTESDSNREVMTSEELMRLNINHSIVIMKSCRPLIVEKLVYTEHPMSKEIIDVNATTHVPKWRKVLEGYPDLPDMELYPVLEAMDADDSIIEYLRMHSNNKRYTLMEYLYENCKERFEVLEGYIRKHAEENEDDEAVLNIPKGESKQQTMHTQAEMTKPIKDFTSQEVDLPLQEKNQTENPDTAGRLKRFNPLNGIVPNAARPAARPELSTPAPQGIKVDAKGRIVHGTSDKPDTSAEQIPPSGGRFAKTSLDEVRKQEETHLQKIHDMQKEDKGEDKPFGESELQKDKESPDGKEMSGKDHTDVPNELQEAISLPGMIRKGDTVPNTIETNEQEEDLDINNLAIKMPEATGKEPEPDSEMDMPDFLSVEEDMYAYSKELLNSEWSKLKSVTATVESPLPIANEISNTPADESGTVEKNKVVEKKPDTNLTENTSTINAMENTSGQEMQTPITKKDFQLFDVDGKVKEDKLSMTVPKIETKIGMKRQADKKARGFTKVSPKDF